MENQKQKKSVGTVLLVILLLIVTIASLILATYAWAKYTSSDTATASADVAKWNVTFSAEDNNKIVKKYDHVVEDKLAPGTSGSFDIGLNINDTEVDVDYVIDITGVTDKPQHLNFYRDESHKDKIVLDSKNAGQVKQGTITKKTAEETTVTIYWDWPYEDENLKETLESTKSALDAKMNEEHTAEQQAYDNAVQAIAAYDKIDTDEGKTAKNMAVSLQVTATQTEPVSSGN